MAIFKPGHGACDERFCGLAKTRAELLQDMAKIHDFATVIGIYNSGLTADIIKITEKWKGIVK